MPNSNNKCPELTIITPIWNREDYIFETLNSILSQSFKNWEAIIVDDGSTDGSLSIVNEFLKIDNRFKLLIRSNPPKGANTCRNIGLQAARGKYVVFLDSDDLIAPSCLSSRITYFEYHPDNDFLVFMCQVFNEKVGDNHKLWNDFNDKNDISRFFRLDAPWGIHCVIWKRSSLIKLDPFVHSSTNLQDWEMHVISLLMNYNYKKIEIIDCFYRLPGKRKTVGNSFKNVKHDESHQMTLLRVARHLRKNQSIFNKNRDLFLSLAFFIARKSTLNKGIINALRFWNNISVVVTCSYSIKVKGSLFLVFHRFPGMKKISRFFLQKHSFLILDIDRKDGLFNTTPDKNLMKQIRSL